MSIQAIKKLSKKTLAHFTWLSTQTEPKLIRWKMTWILQWKFKKRSLQREVKHVLLKSIRFKFKKMQMKFRVVNSEFRINKLSKLNPNFTLSAQLSPLAHGWKK